MERLRGLTVFTGLVLILMACGIKGAPRPPEPPPSPTPELQPPRDPPRGPLEPSGPPPSPDAGS